MQIIISNSSDIPIYQQIVDNIKREILNGNLVGGEALPSKNKSENYLKEEILKKIEENLEEALTIADTYHISYDEVLEILNALKEDNNG